MKRFTTVRNASRFVLAVLLAFCWVTVASAQEIQNNRLKYDAYFNPYIETTIKNNTQKDITTVEFEIVYEGEGASQWDIFRFDYEKQIVKIYVPANSSKFVSFFIPKKEDKEPSYVRLIRARFADGTVNVIRKK